MSTVNKIIYNGTEYTLTPTEEAAIDTNLYFTVGETYTMNNVVVCGFISSSKTVLQFTVPLPKNISLCSGLTISSVKLNIRRPDGGYLEQSASVSGGYEYQGNELYTVAIQRLNRTSFTMKITKSGTWNNLEQNNQPMSVTVEGLTFTTK